MNEYHIDWNSLRKDLGEDKARKLLARRLREAAELVENPKNFPDVLGCCVPGHDKDIGSGDIVEMVSVTLSHPWPG